MRANEFISEDLDRRGFLRGLFGAGAAAAGLGATDANASVKQPQGVGSAIRVDKNYVEPQQTATIKPAKTAQQIQGVVQPRKITPEESRGGRTPQQLRDYIQGYAERYIPREQIARFMGEVAHETANFTSMIENNPEKNIKHYGKPKNPLGNQNMNDAWRYIGRGYLQITGKYNYKYFGDKIKAGLGDQLLENPDLAMRPDVAASLAIVYWRERVAPKIERGASSREIARSINGRKPKGVKDREMKTKQAAAALNNKRV
jgi:predicted chitinase